MFPMLTNISITEIGPGTCMGETSVRGQRSVYELWVTKQSVAWGNNSFAKMYLMKAKKHVEKLDKKEIDEKRDRQNEREKTSDQQPNRSPSIGSKRSEDGKTDEFKPDELPDGACFRPRVVLGKDSDDSDTAIRPAEYVGSFSVSGNEPSTRAEFVQKQLLSMRNVSKSKKVLVVISLSGVKICCSSGESVCMAHALKRISYATCDPEFCQFSFLARQPKGHINVQHCHVFITKTAEEAEELNTIIGNAFKLAYAQQRDKQDKQPTFHEVIEQQLIEQRAKFEEYQEQAQIALQKKLTEIATPTPFSEKARERMEMRRQSYYDETPERELVVGKNRAWAKKEVDKVKHRSPATEAAQAGGRVESPASKNTSGNCSTDLFHSAESAFTPVRQVSHQVPGGSNFPLASLRGFLDNKNNSNSKFKGSPVTALKDAIDSGFICNGTRTSAVPQCEEDTEGYLYPNNANNKKNENRKSGKISNKMVNRPLPAIPPVTNGQSETGKMQNKNWVTMDGDTPPPPMPAMRRANAKDTPKRKPQRPLSEVFYDHKLPSDFQVVPRSRELDEPGMYMYGTRSQLEYKQQQLRKVALASHMENVKKQKSGRNMQEQQYMSENLSEHEVLRYQNDSPFQDESYDSQSQHGSKKQSGLESLMGLDRSHIEDEALRKASWYQAGIQREVALEILQQEDIGAFIVRDSTTHPGCYALSVRVPKFENPTGISHYLILKTQRGVMLKGLDKEWTNLIALVTHHTVMPEMLPCTLRLPRNTNNPTFKDSDKDDKEEDPDYQRLSDFSTMMAALKN
ncbi:hypothetical protein ScPMuIL_009077 [Solemya velum]